MNELNNLSEEMHQWLVKTFIQGIVLGTGSGTDVSSARSCKQRTNILELYNVLV